MRARVHPRTKPSGAEWLGDFPDRFAHLDTYRLNPIVKLKPSGIEGLGEVPEHWSVLPIKRFVATPVTDGPHTTPELVPYGIPLASAESVWDGRIHLDSARGFISSEDHVLFSRKYCPKKEDIYVVKSGSTTGKIAINDLDEEFNIWSPLAAIRCDDSRAEPRFVFYALSSDYFQGLVHVSWSFGTQPNIGMEVIENLLVVLPPLDEQRSIVVFLDKATAKIDVLTTMKRRLIGKLQEKRAALISHVVTRGLDSNALLKPSGIEWLSVIPQHWGASRLGFLVSKIGSGKTPKGGAESYQQSGIMLIRSQNVYDDGLRLDDVAFIDEETDDAMATTRVKPNDVLLNITGASLGRCTLVPPMFPPANVNQHVCIIRPNPTRANASFARYALIAEFTKAQIFADEAGSSREGLNFEQVRDLVLPVPPLDEQVAIAAHIDRETSALDLLTSKVELAIERLKEYRSALITAAVTGKINLREESR